MTLSRRAPPPPNPTSLLHARPSTQHAHARARPHTHTRAHTHTQPAENPDGVPVPATEPLLQLDAGDGTSALAVVLPQVPRPVFIH